MQHVPCREYGSIDQVSGGWFVLSLAILWIFMLLNYRVWKKNSADVLA